MAWERTGLTLLLLLIQNILVGLKLDHVIHSSWWAVFVPVYVWVGIVLIIVSVAFYRFCICSCDPDERYYELSPPPPMDPVVISVVDEEERARNVLSSTRALYFAICALLVLVLIILLAVQAQARGHSMPWAVVFIPIYVYLAVLLVVVVYQGVEYTRGNIERGPMDALPGISSWLWWFWLLNLFVWGLILIILLAVKLDGGLKAWNYWAVLSPLWVLLITAAVLFVSSIPFLILKQLEIHLGYVLFFICTYIAAVLALVFLILRADQSIHWDWSFVFIPLYVLEALFLLYVIANWLHESV